MLHPVVKSLRFQPTKFVLNSFPSFKISGLKWQINALYEILRWLQKLLRTCEARLALVTIRRVNCSRAMRWARKKNKKGRSERTNQIRVDHALSNVMKHDILCPPPFLPSLSINLTRFTVAHSRGVVHTCVIFSFIRPRSFLLKKCSYCLQIPQSKPLFEFRLGSVGIVLHEYQNWEQLL